MTWLEVVIIKEFLMSMMERNLKKSGTTTKNKQYRGTSEDFLKTFWISIPSLPVTRVHGISSDLAFTCTSQWWKLFCLPWMPTYERLRAIFMARLACFRRIFSEPTTMGRAEEAVEVVEGRAGRGGGGSPAQVKDRHPIAEVHQHKSSIWIPTPLQRFTSTSQGIATPLQRYPQHLNPIAEGGIHSIATPLQRYSQHLNPIAEGGIHSISTPLQREVFTASQPHCRGIHSISTTSTSHKSSINHKHKSQVKHLNHKHKSQVKHLNHKHKSQVQHLNHKHKSQVKHPNQVSTSTVTSQASQPQAQVTSQASGSLPHCRGRYPRGHSGTQAHTRPLPSLPTQLNFLRSKSLHHFPPRAPAFRQNMQNLCITTPTAPAFRQVKHLNPIAEGGIHAGTMQEHAGDARSGSAGAVKKFFTACALGRFTGSTSSIASRIIGQKPLSLQNTNGPSLQLPLTPNFVADFY